jgi:hypothetical protein
MPSGSTCPGRRLSASLAKAIHSPSALIEESEAGPFEAAALPAVERLTSRFVPVSRSKRKTCAWGLAVCPGTRSSAWLS